MTACGPGYTVHDYMDSSHHKEIGIIEVSPFVNNGFVMNNNLGFSDIYSVPILCPGPG